MNVIQIVEVGSKLKAQVYGTDKYTRFPKNMREVGQFYVVDHLSDLGSHMGYSGSITPLNTKELWQKAVKAHPSLYQEMPPQFRAEMPIEQAIELLKKTKDPDFYQEIYYLAHLKSNKDALNYLSKKKFLMENL